MAAPLVASRLKVGDLQVKFIPVVCLSELGDKPFAPLPFLDDAICIAQGFLLQHLLLQLVYSRVEISYSSASLLELRC
ncbi:hypothetical protein CLBKND_03556 [Methylorubrum aminovorans]